MLESGHSTAVLIFNLFVILVHKDGYYCVDVIFPLYNFRGVTQAFIALSVEIDGSVFTEK